MDFNIINESGNAVLQTIHSSEGGRAFKLLRQRQKMKNQLEIAKQQIETSAKLKHQVEFGGSGGAEKLEDQFRKETIGLVSAEEFRVKRKKLSEKIEENEKKPIVQPPKKKVGKINVGKLSFLNQDEEEEHEEMLADTSVNSSKNPLEAEGSTSHFQKRSKHLGKDPTVDTIFLADPERDLIAKEEREELIKKYYENQKAAKQELLEVTYSYWDGSGHRRTIRVSKGTTIFEFLDRCRRDLEKDFHELRTVASENLMYIKEDLILPHNATFYDLIKSKARGKSGPLFHFDVHDDIRMVNDVRLEKDESHAGKIVDRKWYDRNRHIFPASRWEMYNPNKTYETYTIHGDEDFSKMI